MSQYTKQIDNFKYWSYSRISGYETCPLAWKMQYLDKIEGGDNAFSQMGSFCHELLEEQLKGNVTPSEMHQIFMDTFYDEVTLDFPPNMYVDLKDNYYKKIGQYFSTYNGVSGMVLAIERKFSYKLPNGLEFMGYIDLETRTDGFINVVDHKVSAFFKKKDLAKKKHQMILYAPAIEMEYGELPKAGYFHFLQDKGLVNPPKKSQFIKVDINEEVIEESLQWAVDTINKAREDELFEPILNSQTDKERNKQKFFCQHICSFREKCPASKEIFGEIVLPLK